MKRDTNTEELLLSGSKTDPHNPHNNGDAAPPTPFLPRVQGNGWCEGWMAQQADCSCGNAPCGHSPLPKRTHAPHGAALALPLVSWAALGKGRTCSSLFSSLYTGIHPTPFPRLSSG